MPVLRSHLFLLISCLLASIAATPAIAQDSELRYGRLSPFCPFTCDIKKHGHYGIVIDIFKAVTAMNNMTYKDVRVPSKRKYIALDSDFSNIATVWSTNDKAMAKTVTAEEPIIASRWGIITRKNVDISFVKLKDLKNIRLVLGDGTDHSGDFNKYVQDNRKSERVHLLYGNELTRRGIEMVRKGRVDAFLTGMIQGGYFIQNNDLSDEMKISYVPYFPTAYIYPGFSKNNPKAHDLAKMMTMGVRELRKSGRLAAMLKEYGLSDWSNGFVAKSE